MQIHTCVRCGHIWASRKLTRPERCAACTAKYWFRAARIPRIKPEPRRQGRPSKYPVGLLNIGQQMTIDWPRNITSMKQAIAAYAGRSGKQFKLVSSAAGLKVTRIL